MNILQYLEANWSFLDLGYVESVVEGFIWIF